MPELPEVESIRRTLEPATVGRRVAAIRVGRKPMRGGSPIARGPLAAAALGASFVAWSRRAKYLRAHMSSGRVIVFHLGMSGRLTLAERTERVEAHTHLLLILDGNMQLRFSDARRFGCVFALEEQGLEDAGVFAALGPEPLSRAFTARRLGEALRDSRRPIKNALLDQGVVGGIGNIYACESLHEALIAPDRASCTLDDAELRRLVAAIKGTLRRAIAGCGTTLRDYADGWGVRGRYQEMLRVFGRAGRPCPRCGHEVRREVLAGRSTFLCPGCQR